MKASSEMTLAEHAEAWWTERGNEVPADAGSTEYDAMYKAWHAFAFKDFGK